MRFRTAIIWNGISQFGQSGISLLSTVILARLLTPDDFGLIGIVTIFIAISQMMVDSEMGGSLLRKKVVTPVDYSTLFWYNLAVSLVIYLILFFTAPLIADFYNRPALTGIIRVLSICTIIHAFRVVQFIMILRALQFKVNALINVTAGLISLGVAIFMAKNGFGYWSLVWQQIILAALTVVMMGCINHYIPDLSFSRKSFRYQFGFGISLLGSNTVTLIANNIAANIIAKISTLEFTGYYTQASRATTFFQSAVGAVFNQSIYPLMAKYETVKDVKRVYRRMLITVILAFGVLTAAMEVAAPWIVRVALGEKWLPVIPIFRILILVVLPICIQVLGRNVMKTLGTTRKVMAVDTAIAVSMLIAMFGAAFIGATYVLWAIVAMQCIGALVWVGVTERGLNTSSFKPAE